ncbi:PiggyBac transposable element-derived protein 4, partial [Stegodyphus mimosarum]
MLRLQKLLEDVSTGEESIDETDNESDNEFFSSHDTDSEIEMDSENEIENDIYCFMGKDKKTKWSKEKPKTDVRTPAHNIITKLPGNIGKAKYVQTPNESWELLLSEQMLLKVVSYTNIYIASISDNFQRERDARYTNLIEIRAFVGLLYFGGVHKSSHVNVRDLWATDGTGLEIFHKTMSYKRFLFLSRCLRFDDIGTRVIRKQSDKLAPIREFFEDFVNNCQKYYTVGEFITIDEKLEAFRGRCSFRQYIPNKPAKYGIKVFALVDARTFYTWNLEIYPGLQPQGPYCVKNTPDEIVKRLCQNLYGSGRNITTDNWYTSYNLAKDLLKKKITIVGTIRKNKRELPAEFVSGKNREVFSSIFGFQKDTTLVSYVPKKNKCVNLLSTMHHDNAIDNETGECKKPEIVTFYNLTKGAVDVVDEMSASYSTSRISKRWPMAVFFSVLNTAAINARILILSSKNPPKSYKINRTFVQFNEQRNEPDNHPHQVNAVSTRDQTKREIAERDEEILESMKEENEASRDVLEEEVKLLELNMEDEALMKLINIDSKEVV